MTMLVSLAPGAVFAREYRVLKKLAEGGMGAVYAVEQISTGKTRALKIMRPTLVIDPKSCDRFAHEARVGSRIKSDHVVEVVGAGVDEATNTPWLAMEFLEGEALDAIVRRAPLAPAEVLEVFEQACHALGAAHRAGVVHCDLKPENLFVATSRQRNVPFVVKVLDFGIARLLQENRAEATVTTVIGSPRWMAPEQAQRGAKIRAETDVWALGLIAFYLLTGRYYWRAANVPAAQSNVLKLLVEVDSGALDPPSVRAAELGARVALPPGFDAWFARCVARACEQRFADATAALEALRPALAARAGQVPGAAPARSASRSRGLALAGAAALAVLAAGGVVWTLARGEPGPARARTRTAAPTVDAATTARAEPASTPWVRLADHGVEIQSREVSRGEYRRWCPDVGEGADAAPVADVSRDDAAAYCAALAEGARLPTKGEWHAALGGRPPARGRWWGADATLTAGAAGGNASDVSPLGVRDLVGGVREWVSDDAAGRHLSMGAAATDRDDEKRARAIHGAPASGASPAIGFRCVRPAP